MINDGMFSSKTDMWETPQDLFDNLDSEFHFTLDVCAVKENAKCKNFYSPEQDGLSQPWTGRVWCNPPYGRQIGRWVRRALFASGTGATVVMLLPARTDTKWFHEYIYHKAEIRFIRGRLKFGGAKNSAPFPSMVVIFRPRAIAVLAESKRQNEVMRDNPSTFWVSHQMADGVKNAERRIAPLTLPAPPDRRPPEGEGDT